MAIRESWHNVGRKIRALRKAHELTIKQLANGCGLSPNAISLLERGEVAPTVATLCKIASALGTSASSFFQEVCSNEVILTRAQEPYAQQPVARALGVLTCAVSPVPSNIDDESSLSSDCARELVLCLSGQIEYEADGQSYLLQPGDSLSFNGSVLHCWRSRSSDPAVAVMVIYPGAKQDLKGE